MAVEKNWSESGEANDKSILDAIAERQVSSVSSETDTAEVPIERGVETTFRLIYRSRSLLPPRADGGNQGLSEILKIARRNNHARGVTGALVLYEHKNRFAQVLEGAESDVRALFEKIKEDSRHDNVDVRHADAVDAGVFRRWAMALVLEHRESDIPLVATSGGVAEASPWRVTAEQERVLNLLRDLTRGYGRAY